MTFAENTILIFDVSSELIRPNLKFGYTELLNFIENIV